MQGAQATTSLPQTEADAKGSKSEGKNQNKVDNVSKRAVEAYITRVATIIFYSSLRKYTPILGEDAKQTKVTRQPPHVLTSSMVKMDPQEMGDNHQGLKQTSGDGKHSPCKRHMDPLESNVQTCNQYLF